MKKILLMAIICVLIAGCSSTTSDTEETTEQEVTESTDTDDNNDDSDDTESTGTTEGFGESTKFSPYRTTAKVEMDGSDVVSVTFEEFLEDGTNKITASKNGEYSSDAYTLGEFYEQVESLEEYVIENDSFPSLSNGKDADAVSGASVNLSGFEEAFLKAVEDAQN